MNLRRLLPIALGLLVATTVRAERRERGEETGRARERGPRVVFFQHADFRGEALVVYPGEAIDNLAGVSFESGGSINDRISSVRIEGAAEVYVYEHSRYRGQVMRLTENVRDLSGRLLPGGVSASWNDRISSLRVEGGRGRRDTPRVEPDPIIRRAYIDILTREPDESGLRHYRGLIIDQGWTERMVRDNLRRSDEFRRDGADRIIRQAYLDLLGREPDPSGLKQYRWALIEKDWTEGDVRDALRKSDEFRLKSVGR